MARRHTFLAALVAVAATGTAAAQVPGQTLPPPGSAFATAGVAVSQPQTVPGVIAAQTTQAPAPAPAEAPTLEELGKKLEVLGKSLTVTTGDGDFKLVLGGL